MVLWSRVEPSSSPLQPPGEGALTIINIYAALHSTDRAHLWKKVSQANFSADHVILGGDFNHQEMVDGRGSAGLRQMNRREASAWHSMTLKYGLSDAWHLNSFRKLSKKDFTFDNGRSGASSALSRIDKFLVSQSVEERGGRIEVAASVRKLSDHSPFVISVWGKHLDVPRNRPCYFDSSFLSEVDGRKELWEAWIGNHPPPPPHRSFA
jgi:endonuclease/exonuclease/phosphatase family metal-dependent hydrolase